MVAGPLTLVASLLFQTGTGSTVAQPSPCLDALSQGASAAVIEICRGDEQFSLAEKAPARSQERRRLLLDSAVHYRRAGLLPTTTPVQVQALEALARVYDEDHLSEAGELEAVLLELASLVPENLTYLFRLAKIQEQQERFDTAESTLLAARSRQPAEVEAYRQLAQFFARRSVALQGPPVRPAEPTTDAAAPDEHGIYQVGGRVPSPQRLDVARYPEEAQAAGIDGVVQAEITINDQGLVTNATVVRSVPLLDEPALKAVQQWRFEPAVVNGKPVPVKMLVSVRFSLSK